MRSAKRKLEFDPQIAPRARGLANPIVPGDHPDPTIVRVGSTFWASSTSGEWSPQFPLFRSSDLIDWLPSGSIFPVQPAWAEGSFWAPELVHDELSGLCFVWYVARKRRGSLCIAVATSLLPGGPYTDHGPILGEPDGSIDPCFARDEHGEPFLIWKEDGNSAGRPTPIWAQPLTEDLLHLTGTKTQILINDQPWEEGVVEGPYILHKQGRFYMFYAGNSCCGKECKYAEGVARADRLLGPWEKFPGNPLLGPNDQWRCPGHGTAVHSALREGGPEHDYLLYHAYPAGESIYVGREALLDQISWSAPEADGRPGWPQINAGRGPGQSVPAPAIDFIDGFLSDQLGPAWQWPVNTYPDVTLKDGQLTLGIPLETPFADKPVESALLAVPRPATMRYRAAVGLRVPAHSDPALWAGLAIIGDPFNTVGLGLRGKPDGQGHNLILWHRRGSMQEILWQAPTPAGELIYLRSTNISPNHCLQFAFSFDNQEWHDTGEKYDASDLPAWDRGLRIGLLLEGPCGRAASFQSFELRGL